MAAAGLAALLLFDEFLVRRKFTHSGQKFVRSESDIDAKADIILCNEYVVELDQEIYLRARFCGGGVLAFESVRTLRVI